MADPYRMIFVNLVLCASLLLALFFYTRILRKKINLLVLLIFISILPVVSIFRKGVYESGDFIDHIYRSMSFFDALKDGITIPSWGALLNQGFGYPVFSFIYVIPYYLISFFHSLGFTFIFSERLVLTIAFIGSGIAMYFALKELSKNKLASFSGSIIYLFSPYHLVDLHFRVAIAESLAFLIVPTIFYLILKMRDEIKFIYIAWMGLLFGVLFLTHPVMFIFYSAIFFLYVFYEIIINQTKPKIFLAVLGSFFIGLLISSFAWGTRFTLTKFTEGSLLANAPVSFVKPWELLFSPWRFGFQQDKRVWTARRRERREFLKH